MYKILIVEDESLIRESVRNVIEGMSGPYVLCGEAEDGEIALSIMQDTMPDILITDLRMPFLDGFGLISQAKAIMPWLKIIILSGYGDFESAQRLIAMGVDKYLLKPVRSSEIAAAVQEMAAKLENEKKLQALPFGFARDEIYEAMFQNFMKDILRGHCSANELLEKAKALGLNMVAPYYELVLFHFDIADGESERLHAQCIRLTEKMDIRLYYFHVFDGLVLLLTGSQQDQLKEESYKLNLIFRHELEDLSPFITTMISHIFSRLSLVAEHFHKMESLMQKAWHTALGRVIDMDDTLEMTTEIMQSSAPAGDTFWSDLLSVPQDEIAARIDEHIRENAYSSVMYRSTILMNITRMLTERFKASGAETDSKAALSRLLTQFDILTSAEHKSTFRDTALAMIRFGASYRADHLAELPRPPMIENAERYMRENYCDPNISLVSVAQHVCMSPSHFSTVFSQTYGKTFIALLTDLRIEKAKELLGNTDMRVTDIALQIGYNEPNYFSHVFKKAVGLSPKEYRIKMQNNED